MQVWFLRILILALTAANLMGCAERHRDADVGRSAQEVEQFLEEMRNTPAAQGAGLPQALVMKDDPSTNIYFAESYRDPDGSVAPMGPIEAVTPVDFHQLNLNVNLSEIKIVRVFFLDQISSDGRHNHAFVIHITGPAQPLTFAVANDGSNGDPESEVDGDGVFQVRFSMGNGKTLILDSTDTTEGELNNVVQFRLLIDDNQGEPYPIGQISSMVGFLSK